jgi:hypothetical protein
MIKGAVDSVLIIIVNLHLGLLVNDLAYSQLLYQKIFR